MSPSALPPPASESAPPPSSLAHPARRPAALPPPQNITPSTDRQPWDLGRFGRTVLFFNTSGLLGFLGRLLGNDAAPAAPAAGPTSAASAAAPAAAMIPLIDRRQQGAPSALPGVTLVTGATGGVGKRAVSLLLARGAHVRALVRDVPKARDLLSGLDAAPGAFLELLPADLTQPATLPASAFAGVRRVLSAAACVVQPKEGDDARRSKYMQGIQFFDPEIASDAPVDVELRGMQALLERVAPSVGSAKGLALLDAGAPGAAEALRRQWGALDDVVMGGVSESSMVFQAAAGPDAPAAAAVFRGVVSTANRGGFASTRSRNFEPAVDVAAYDGLELVVRGDGQRYKCILRSDPAWDGVGYTCSFVAEKKSDGDGWTTARLPFSSFKPVFRAKTLVGEPPFDPRTQPIASMQLMLSKFEYDGALNPEFREGAFELPIRAIGAYVSPASVGAPRLVHVSSAGVTRPDRPGIDVEQEPPAVKLNDALGGLLTYKLAGEQAVRDSGVPFCVVRPCALTEEPRGMPVLASQGDTIKGKVGRDDVAELCVEILAGKALSPGVGTDATFEIKSTVPFSQPWTPEASAEALAAEGVAGGGAAASTRDWAKLLPAGGLRRGVTGRTIGGAYSGDAVEPGYVDVWKAEEEEEEARRGVVGPAPAAREEARVAA
jgi:uncharacterized protein YbjT (DUF2867 family)